MMGRVERLMHSLRGDCLLSLLWLLERWQVKDNPRVPSLFSVKSQDPFGNLLPTCATGFQRHSAHLVTRNQYFYTRMSEIVLRVFKPHRPFSILIKKNNWIHTLGAKRVSHSLWWMDVSVCQNTMDSKAEYFLPSWWCETLPWRRLCMDAEG